MARKKIETVRIDYDKVYKYMELKELDAVSVSALCGKSRNWMGMIRRNDQRLRVPAANLLASVIGADVDAIIIKEDAVKKEKTERQVNVDALEQSISKLSEQVQALSDKVEMLTEVVRIQQDDILSILAGSNKIASAVAIANAMLQASGRCKESRYREACSKRGIDGEEMKRALDDVGAHYEVVGKGGQAIRWIVKERITA